LEGSISISECVNSLVQEDEEIDGSILQMMFDDENGDDLLAESLKTKK
jgi:hypothetical protein